MLPPITPAQFPALQRRATGPFSYIFRLPVWAKEKLPGLKYTDYPSPDGGWEWKTCRTWEWTPELSGYPPSKNT